MRTTQLAGLITGKTAKLPGDYKPQPTVQKNRPGLESGFLRLLRSRHSTLPSPLQEHRFHPTRKWRFDFAWPEAMLAVELEGTIYGGGRHQRREGFNKDAEKYREAVKLGWRVMRYTSDDLKQRPVQCVDEVAELLKPT